MHSSRFFPTLLIALVLAITAATPAHAEKYDLLSQRDFLAGAFPDGKPQAGKLDITDYLADRLGAIFRHRFREDRVRYWRAGTRTAWLLEEVGKEKPITIGVVVDNARLVSIAVLVYREGHGMEVAEPEFTRQYPGAALVNSGNNDNDQDALDRDIDNITGSTLSVRAMTRTARAALVLDAWLRENEIRNP